MLEKIKNASKKKKIIAVVLILMAIIAIVFLIFRVKKELDKPVLSLIPPKPIESTSREEFVVNAQLSALPHNLYPAASISVSFDNTKLEFTGVKMGTMMTYGDKRANGYSFDVPQWSCNTEVSNLKGEINAMYLDTTAGKYAYCSEGFDSDKKNIVLRLGFKLKDSAIAGDSYNLTFKDGVFAVVDGDESKESLAMKLGTLRTNNCRIVVK